MSLAKVYLDFIYPCLRHKLLQASWYSSVFSYFFKGKEKLYTRFDLSKVVIEKIDFLKVSLVGCDVFGYFQNGYGPFGVVGYV